VPFLRVIRDKRGYETTYLMHWCREGSKQRSRILYVFRTPGGVRVGREALDPDVLKQIEAQHPDIDFDWNVVFHNQQVIETTPELRRPRKRPTAEGGEPVPAQQQQAPPRFTVPATVEGATPDEQIAFLNIWYVAVREKIPQRAADPARQAVLFALAERLNPAAWTDADQITAGLQHAAEALQRLSLVFAKRRRRSKKRSGGAKPDASELSAPTERFESAEPSEPAELSEPAEPSEPSEPSEP
jgi:hypothetical protein